MDIRITEASLSFGVTKAPKTYVGREVPYLVNSIGKEVERVIPADEKCPLPSWMLKQHAESFRFIYSSSMQNIECSYDNKHSVVTLHCVKLKNIEQTKRNHISHIAKILGTQLTKAPVIEKYKAIARICISVPWDTNVLADIIMNNPEISRTMAICEKSSTLGNRKMFTVAVCIGDELCKIALTCKNFFVTAMISKLPDSNSVEFASEALQRLITIYSYNAPLLHVSLHTDAPVSGIGELRKVLPELFVKNYTRECPMLPIMISQSEAERMMHTKRVILYPICEDSGKSRYYTAPDGYFVGLKRNRLENKDEFPYLVTCYVQDHMNRVGSDTNRYYHGEAEFKKDVRTRKRPLPKFIYDPRYHREKASSFVDAVEHATRTKIEHFPWCPQVVRQELWDSSDEDIMSAIRGHGPGSCVYRYFEELIGVSIHVVVIRDGNFEPLVPRHKGHYVWSTSHPLHIVVFETYRTTYGVPSCSYSFLAIGDTTVFETEDSIVSYLIAQKKSDSVAPPELDDKVCEQVIDRNGKCSLIVTTNGDHIRTYTRPLSVPLMPEPASFLDLHVRKMNAVKMEMGIETIDLSKRSTNYVLYFPNERSFLHYVGSVERVDAS